MHKIALEPKGPSQLWADRSGMGVEDSELERRDHAGMRLDSKDPHAVPHSSPPLRLHGNSEHGTRVLNDIVSSCGAVSQPIGG
jgi:hypothetical protein